MDISVEAFTGKLYVLFDNFLIHDRASRHIRDGLSDVAKVNSP